MLAADKV